MRKPIQLIAVGDGVSLRLLDRLSADMARVFGVSCHVRTDAVDPSLAFDPARRQFHSTAILQMMTVRANGMRLLGVTESDLFVPILTYVFGEAQLQGDCALVSLHRLHEEFYGMAADEGRLIGRLVKEAVHELGHTFGLRHCQDWRCAMASTHVVERLDLKEAAFCAACRRVVG